ncbi:EH signature domain-containing protein [Paraferrimonas sp. SM1919]|uniref:EH signature domain-containing protein n=1 Tax=Paraferrimonas sp. SM1919 TaxID=2662263 RepID=UPI0013D4457B|nr:EH signature domain-containing protein [Paraferrimonas sp. SM1919]
MFAEPVIPKKNSLIKVKASDTALQIQVTGVLPSNPPKTLEKILELLKRGEGDRIAVMEWLWSIEDNSQWEMLPFEDNFDAIILYWQAILHYGHIAKMAFFKLALVFDGNPNELGADFLKGYDTASPFLQSSNTYKDKVEWLEAIKACQTNSDGILTMAKQCAAHLQTPQARITHLTLPSVNTYLERVYKAVPDFATDSNSSINWFYDCFKTLKVTQDKVDFIELALQQSYSKASCLPFMAIIKSHCHPDATNSLWLYFSTEAQAKITKLLQLTDFYYLKSLSKALTTEQAATELGLSETEQNNIRSRTAFWSNYRAQFVRFKAILPINTYDFLRSESKVLMKHAIKTARADDKTEALIFSTETLIVVEFLRKGNSEVRLFKKNNWIEQQLFDKAKSLDYIYELFQDEAHDHITLWQYYLEKMLRQRFGLAADNNVTSFTGIPKAFSNYSHKDGLTVKPNEELLIKRKVELESWAEKFWKWELNLNKYKCSKVSGAVRVSNLKHDMHKAMVAKHLGNDNEYQHHLKKAADAKHPEALFQLACEERKSCNDVFREVQAEKLIFDLAGQGFVKAQKYKKENKLEFQPHNESPRHWMVALDNFLEKSMVRQSDFIIDLITNGKGVYITSAMQKKLVELYNTTQQENTKKLLSTVIGDEYLPDNGAYKNEVKWLEALENFQQLLPNHQRALLSKLYNDGNSIQRRKIRVKLTTLQPKVNETVSGYIASMLRETREAITSDEKNQQELDDQLQAALDAFN